MLYPRKERDRIDALCRALRQVAEVCWVSNEADPKGVCGRWRGRGCGC